MAQEGWRMALCTFAKVEATGIGGWVGFDPPSLHPANDMTPTAAIRSGRT